MADCPAQQSLGQIAAKARFPLSATSYPKKSAPRSSEARFWVWSYRSGLRVGFADFIGGFLVKAYAIVGKECVKLT